MSGPQHIFTKLRQHLPRRPGSLMKPSAPYNGTTEQYKTFVAQLEAYDAAVEAHKLNCTNWEAERKAILEELREYALNEWTGSRFNRDAVAYIYDITMDKKTGTIEESFDDFDDRIREEVEFWIINNRKG